MRYSIYRKRNLVGLKNGKLYPISDLFNIFEISFPKGKPQANFDDAKNTSKKQRAKEPNESSLAPHPSQYHEKVGKFILIGTP